MAEAFIKLRTGANGKTRKVLIPAAQMLDEFVRRLPTGTGGHCRHEERVRAAHGRRSYLPGHRAAAPAIIVRVRCPSAFGWR